MFTKKKTQQQELPGVDGGDDDKLKFIRPERVRTESKSYTPSKRTIAFVFLLFHCVVGLLLQGTGALFNVALKEGKYLIQL